MDDVLRTLREREFARLDADGQAYLDHTGSALYPASLVEAHAELLRSGVFGNPHSRSPASHASTALVERARRRVLDFFQGDPDEYAVVFTANATGALKLVGEGFPFTPASRCVLSADNHNSVNGLRAYAEAAGADVRYALLGHDLRVLDIERELVGADRSACNLFAFPAQSNFSGVKHPLEWIEMARGLGYDVALDAAAFVPSSPLSLTEVRPDYMAVSFYKMFGYPTGVGALVARREKLRKLRRVWFGGGTVRFASVQSRVHISYRDAAGLEDGTPNFLDIAAVPTGLDFLAAIGMERVQRHVRALTEHLLGELGALRHENGAPLVSVYGPSGAAGRGGTVAFNLLDPAGRVVDCREVEQAATEAGISLRTGYFCNPGAAEASFELPPDEAKRCYEELAGGDNADAFTLRQFSVCLQNKPVGAVRVSVGVSSNEADVARLVACLASFRDRPAPAPRRSSAQATVR
ncbi:MAG TPA: aminotransferase class V-fold PLP-dependent enzyme [Gemmatimonadaceae bacterium]|nr:aminotransferase class V-fold PLP-dependent enzyme [Gemmatimonadaceae bacterium]